MPHDQILVQMTIVIINGNISVSYDYEMTQWRKIVIWRWKWKFMIYIYQLCELNEFLSTHLGIVIQSQQLLMLFS